MVNNIVTIFYNIVTVLSIFTILCNNIVIIYVTNIVEIDNMVKNIVTIFFTILSKWTILLTILLHCVDHSASDLGEVCWWKGKHIWWLYCESWRYKGQNRQKNLTEFTQYLRILLQYGGFYLNMGNNMKNMTKFAKGRY